MNLSARLRESRLLNFNQVERDRWVRAQAARIPAGSRVLDVGAGSAPYRQDFAHCEYRTHDFGKLEAGQLLNSGYSRIDYVSDIAALPVRDASFDVVLCTEVLEHVPAPVDAVGELARILRPGGHLILTAPLGSGIHQEPFHFYGGYTPFWYQRFLTDAGFRDIAIESNCGSFRFFAQEALRFVRTSGPFRLAMPIWLHIVWLPLWLLLVPILAGLVPVLCAVLDRYDGEKRFTVGYHVTAVRAGAQP
jgi:SAM-dependent methyltransferase